MSDVVRSLTSLPNLHPALVHFPIALLTSALGFDVAALALRRQRWLDRAATSLWVLGALGAFAAYLAGRSAADSVPLAPELEGHVAAHADWALRLLVLFTVVAGLRLVVAVRDHAAELTPRGAARWGLVALAVAGQVTVFETADHGGALVFVHGVAVADHAPAAPTAHPPSTGHDDVPLDRAAPPNGDVADALHEAKATPATPPSDAADLTRGTDGSVAWHPSAVARVPGDAVSLLAGDPGAVRVAGAAPGGGVEIDVDGRAVLVLPGDLGDAAVTLNGDLSAFDGTVGLVHHARDARHADWLAIDTSGRARLVRLEDGKETEIASEPLALPGGSTEWTATVSGHHLKGKRGDATLVHGHAEEPPPGRTGLLLDGRGRVVIRTLEAHPLTGH